MFDLHLLSLETFLPLTRLSTLVSGVTDFHQTTRDLLEWTLCSRGFPQSSWYTSVVEPLPFLLNL